ncbi:unnamed protein product [Blepharisma stoltei]|uniref:Uncharacterized protein n=1 Tax=Blepharisma stoltei TaxID=1481888 RepID=A0AAU9JBF4_9CILI|nr:unnamed protein product [Blepharisma stoltei]
MSIELSPNEEKRLHSILDRGIEALRDSGEFSHSQIMTSKSQSQLESSFKGSAGTLSTNALQDSSKVSNINSELLALQGKFAELEAKLARRTPSPIENIKTTKKISNPTKSSLKSTKKTPRRPLNRYNSNSPNLSRNSSKKSPLNSKKSSRKSSASSIKRSSSNSRVYQSIENSEREIYKLERSMTPLSRAQSININRNIDKIRQQLDEERKIGEKLTRENDNLKRELGKRDELRKKIAKLQDDYNELAISFERSEAVRKKQKDLIEKLKAELRILQEDPGAIRELPRAADQYIRPPSAKIKKKSGKKGKSYKP